MAENSEKKNAECIFKQTSRGISERNIGRFLKIIFWIIIEEICGKFSIRISVEIS